jgi:heme exporter protein B
MNAFFTIVKYDLKLAARKGGSVINLLAFFVIAATLFPFGIGSESGLLMQIGAGVIWVCALLASMLSIFDFFDEIYENGSLAQLLLQGIMPEYIVLAKMFSCWLINILPLIIISPFLAILFNIEAKIWPLFLALLAGTPTLCVLGALGAALTLGLKRAGGLVGIIILPLYIPVLIFGVGAINNDDFQSNVLLLIGLLLFMLPVGVIACAAAVKIAIEDF